MSKFRFSRANNYFYRNNLKLNAVSAIADDPNVFKVGPLFKILEEAMQEDKDNLIEDVRGIYCFKVKNAEGKQGMWIINAKTGKGSVTYNGKGILKFSKFGIKL